MRMADSPAALPRILLDQYLLLRSQEDRDAYVVALIGELSAQMMLQQISLRRKST